MKIERIIKGITGNEIKDNTIRIKHLFVFIFVSPIMFLAFVIFLIEDLISWVGNIKLFKIRK